MEAGDRNGLSDLTQSVSFVLGSLGEVRPCGKVPSDLLAANLLSPSEIPGEGGLVALDLPLSTPSGTGWITPLWHGVSTAALGGTGMGTGMGIGTGRGTMMG